jgi:peroxiredoxin
VDTVVVLAANDPFVMSAWGRSEGLPDKVCEIYPLSAQTAFLIGA